MTIERDSELPTDRVLKFDQIYQYLASSLVALETDRKFTENRPGYRQACVKCLKSSLNSLKTELIEILWHGLDVDMADFEKVEKHYRLYKTIKEKLDILNIQVRGGSS